MHLFFRCASALLAFYLLAGTQAQAASIEVKAVRYPAWVENSGRKTPLQPGMHARAGDVVASGEDARILFRLADGGEVRLGQNARLSIRHIDVATSGGGVDLNMGLALLAGHFRYAANTLSKLSNRRTLDLELSTSTIGIRGTDYWAMTDKEHDAVCLFEGAVEVQTQERESIRLEQPTAFWVRYFDKPAQAPGNATAAQLAQFLGWVELAPGSGVAIAEGRWRLVVGAEKNRADAMALSKRLREQGFPTVVVKLAGLHEVRLNKLATQADAEALLKKLQTAGGMLGSEPKVVLAR
jgi:hypothetical protein